MKKNISTIEKILGLIIIALFLISLIVNFIINKNDALMLIINSFSFGFRILFKGGLLASLLLILIILLILSFAGYWVINIIRCKKISFGPLYILLFFIIFLYTNGYANIIVELDAYFAFLAVTIGVIIISTIICFAFYLKYLSAIENGEDLYE